MYDIERWTKFTSFRDLKSIDDFDFEFNPSVNKKITFDLPAGDFVRKTHDALLIRLIARGLSPVSCPRFLVIFIGRADHSPSAPGMMWGYLA
jgi:hypothetical protein